jgi:2TM domain
MDHHIPPSISNDPAALREFHIRRQVRHLAKFYRHAAIYCLVITGLCILNATQIYYLGSRERWWVFFPAFGWGIGLLIHGINVGGLTMGFLDSTWEERKVQKLLEQAQKK